VAYNRPSVHTGRLWVQFGPAGAQQCTSIMCTFANAAWSEALTSPLTVARKGAIHRAADSYLPIPGRKAVITQHTGVADRPSYNQHADAWFYVQSNLAKRGAGMPCNPTCPCTHGSFGSNSSHQCCQRWISQNTPAHQTRPSQSVLLVRLSRHIPSNTHPHAHTPSKHTEKWIGGPRSTR